MSRGLAVGAALGSAQSLQRAPPTDAAPMRARARLLSALDLSPHVPWPRISCSRVPCLWPPLAGDWRREFAEARATAALVSPRFDRSRCLPAVVRSPSLRRLLAGWECRRPGAAAGTGRGRRTSRRRAAARRGVPVVEFVREDPSAVVPLAVGVDAAGVCGASACRCGFCWSPLEGTYDCFCHVSDGSAERARAGPWSSRGTGAGAYVDDECFPAARRVFAPSRGSHGHPACAGACAHFHGKGGCRFGLMCVDCHAPGCTTPRARANERPPRQRERARREPVLP